jgi:glycerol-3-phosphate acyltransferase PlsX
VNVTSRPIIGIDAAGGDHGPSVVVPGAVAALRVVHCAEEIDMGESPASAIRSKPDSPIVRALTDHKTGQVAAVLSAGSTGAMVAGSLILLGRIPGVDRPAIGTVVPAIEGEMLMLDAGANTQCTPAHLVSFARMGVVFVREILGIAEPRVGQLNIGGEPKKGNDLTVAAHELLAAADVNFIGNVEGNQILIGPCDVLVTDGFTGNNTLKIIEGFAHFLHALAGRPDLAEHERQALGPVLGVLLREYSYEVYGGALLLGVQGISIIAHGRSSERAITNATKVAARQIDCNLPAKLADVLKA